MATGLPYDERVNLAYQLVNASQLQGKELSYNNYLDLDAAWAAVREFRSGCVIIKRQTPCGVADNDDIVRAYQDAHDCDPVGAYGGVMAFSVEVPAELIEAIYANGQFVEAIVAPSFTPGALGLLADKPNVRVLATGGKNRPGIGFDIRSIEGGVLMQQTDCALECPGKFKVVTECIPSDEQSRELHFAWRVCKSVKSNAIVITKDGATVGIGTGQPNRVKSAELAVQQAGEKARGAVAASDAFFPFCDGFDVLAAAGVAAVIHPGGSVRDQEIIDAANAANMVIICTHTRHFRH